MRIRVLGAGWFGSHLSMALLGRGHEVEVHEVAPHIFAGASGGNPARCHLGFHYPRSRLTRAACQDHQVEFMTYYGHLTRAVPVNIYAIASHDSLVDFGTYTQLLRGEVEFVTIEYPEEFGLCNVEGAVLTGERHIVIREARKHFTAQLGDHVKTCMEPGRVDDPAWDLTVDCTFCANDAEAIDRYEPCITALLEGPTDRAVTVMDGPFCSLFPWDEDYGLSSLTSALLTPFSKTCRTWVDAKALLDGLTDADCRERANMMMIQMAIFWPAVRDLYRVVDWKLSIRAMPRSAADARLVDVVRIGERALRVRAGKIDAVFHAERMICDILAESGRSAAPKCVYDRGPNPSKCSNPRKCEDLGTCKAGPGTIKEAVA